MYKLLRPQRFSWAIVLFFCLLLTLVGGVTLQRGAAQTTNPRSLVGQWNGPFSWPIVAMHVHVLPNGKVLAWQGVISPRGVGTVAGGKESRVWDPVTNTFTKVPNNRTELFCSGHSFLPDGRMLVTGGHVLFDQNGEPLGSPQTNVFDFRTNKWSAALDMNDRRWYPTNTTLRRGSVLVISGSIDSYTNYNTLPQVWQIADGTWRDLTNARRALPLYPWMFVAPNGSRVFNAGPNRDTQYLETSERGGWTFVANSNFRNNDFYGRDYGSAVMYDDGKVLIVGGSDPPTNTAEVINLNDATPRWRYTNSMANARRQMNATLLPDGKVLVTGGTKFGGFNNQDRAGVVLNAEMWDPQTETWSTMAPMQVPRLYHSTAVLLPDGRILSGGGGQGGGGIDYYNVEFYSPPYLFNRDGSLAKRPKITSAPTSVKYNQTFFVQTPDAADITQATWIRLSSVTHSFNMNQRINRLSFSRASGGLNITAPANNNLAPPGHYMLFILKNGVPSVANIIQIDQ